MNKTKKMMKTKGDIAVSVFVTFFVTLFCLFVLFPFIMMLSSSFETESNIVKYGFSLFPRDFTLASYKYLLSDDQILRAYGVTIFITVVGTLLSMLATVSIAYGLAQKKVKFKNGVTFFLYFTMLFSGGLAPSYLLISKYLGMRDTIWVMIIPILFSPWNAFLMRNFFKTIPEELTESAYIDGAHELIILFKIILPISVPGIATISLFYALGYWNQWYQAMLFIDDRTLFPLQYIIMELVNRADFIKNVANSAGIPTAEMPSNSLKMATTVITIGPIVLLYPFLQKYFTSGLTVGAIKG